VIQSVLIARIRRINQYKFAMAIVQLVLATLVFAPTAATVAEGFGCVDHPWNDQGQKDPCYRRCEDCVTICGVGLGRKEGSRACKSCYNSCLVHSIVTTSSSDYGSQKQGAYMQYRMQEYCNLGECGYTPPTKNLLQKEAKQEAKEEEKKQEKKQETLLAQNRAVHRHKQPYYYSPWAPAPPPANPRNPWGYPAAGGGSSATCKTQKYYCSKMCRKLFHSITTDAAEHAGTEDCYDQWDCPNYDECLSDCKQNWENGMRPLYDEFCACQADDPLTYPTFGQSLLEMASKEHTAPQGEEAESVDVGAFIQTSISGQKEDEL